MNRILVYGIVGALFLGLLGGSAWILTRPADAVERVAQANAGSGRGRVAAETGVAQGGGHRGGVNAGVADVAARETGRGGNGGSGGGGQSSTQETGRAYTDALVWETFTGVVTAADTEITLQTTEGASVTVSLGQSGYSAGFAVAVGDQVQVVAFYEDGEYKAGSIENLTTGQSLALRDELGRPLWAGGGQGGQNRP